ncbi:MAG: HEAT repeat domain-containing protein [Planctomycetes bacterium]|nr:HEAT repeat domain-containing protein [Planctomycetota bacterium]
MSEERIRRILTKLRRAKQIGRDTYQSKHHKYVLNPPLTEAAVAAFEQEHGITLPEDYRSFLTLAGNGGAGPHYGILPLSHWNDLGLENKDTLLVRPSPLTPELSFDRKLNDGESVDVDLLYQGTITIASRGCEYMCVLIITGTHRGRVVDISGGGDGYSFPDNPDFLSWYERWLDELLEGRDLRFFGRGMTGSESVLAAAISDRTLPVKRRLAAFTSIGDIPMPTKDSILAVAGALNDESPELRGLAASYLGLWRYREAEPTIRKLMNDADSDVRMRALLALEDFEVADLEALCRSSLQDPHVEFVAWAIEGLGKLNRITREDVEPLMNSGDSHLRYAALRGLEACGDWKKVRPLVRRYLEDPDWELRSCAHWIVFQNADRDDVPWLIEKIQGSSWHRDYRDLVVKLGSLGDSRATVVLAEALRSFSDFETRRTLIEALERSGDRRATPALIEMLSDPEGPVRFAAIRALKRAGDLRAIKALKRFTDPTLRPKHTMAATASEAIWRIRLRSWIRFRFW